MMTLCWGLYALLYLGRLNISPALPAIASDLSISRAEVGLIGTAFFWVYAVGQFVNGNLGNTIRPRVMIAMSIALVALTNLAFAMITSLEAMIVIWGICALGHSMSWGPMLRILAERLNEAQRKRISTIFPMSYQLGSALAWLLSGWLVALFGWQAAFTVPGLLLAVLLVVWWLVRIDAPLKAPIAQAAPTVQRAERPVFLRFSSKELALDLADVRLALFGAAMLGFVNVGVVIWLPTYVSDTEWLPSALAPALTALLPLFGIVGMVFSGYLLRRYRFALFALSVLLGLSAGAFAMSAVLPPPAQIAAVVLGIVCLGGSSGLALSTVPMVLARRGRTSSLVGTLTAVYNIGGGFAGFAIGALAGQQAWLEVFFLWAVCLLISSGLFWITRQREMSSDYKPNAIGR